MLADENDAFIAAVERSFTAGEMQKEHLGPIPGTRLQQLTSVAFGVDPREVYLGSLHGDCLYRARIDE